MEPLSKVRIPTALGGHRPQPKTGTHTTTQDFCQLRPFGYHHPIPGTSGTVHGVAKTNLFPIAQPIYGVARQNLRGFWVPYRLICPDFDNFITDTPSYLGDEASIPQEAVLLEPSILDEFALGLSTPATADQIAAGAFDWQDEQGQKYVYSVGMRHFLVILESLGYKILHNPKNVVTKPYNAFALLAYAKVWLDWYANGQYLDSNYVSQLELLFTRTVCGYSLTREDVVLCLTASQRVGYDSNSYFISAWDSPVAPNPGNVSNYNIPDVTVDESKYHSVVKNSTTGYNTPSIIGLTSGGSTNFGPYNLSQFSLDSLKALTDFLKRNQLSGRAIDRYLARYGVQLKGESIKRSVYLGFKSIDVNFGQVVQTADTNLNGDSNLGDKAGIGSSDGSYSFNYDTQGEHGIVILMSSILPDGDLVQGFDRNNRHITRTDFFQPEFDQLGVQAIEKGELVTFNDRSRVLGNGYFGVFGFCPTYSEYKVGRSLFTGDLSLKSVMNGGRNWTLYRFVDQLFVNTDDLVHSLAFTLGSDGSQYDRIFTVIGSNFDHFICFYSIDWDESSPAKSLFDTYDFKQNGKDVTLDSNGVKVN